MKFSRDEHAIWITCVTVIAVFSGLLYYDLTASRGSGAGEIVGWITYKENSAQRKFSDEVVWESLPNIRRKEKRIPVYNRDAIRTADLAQAVITLKRDGSKITLEANSMIILNISDKNASIDYAYGSIKANAGGKGALSIKTKDNKTININNSDVKIAGGAGQNVNVTVNRGQAKIAQDGKEQTVGKDQVAVMGKEITVRPLSFRLNAPADNARIFTEAKVADVGFSWTHSGKSGDTKLQIATDAAFEKVIRTVPARDSAYSAQLKPAVYFWRLSAVNADSGRTEYSPSQRLAVYQKERPQIAVPREGARIDYVQEEPLVSFAWSQSEFSNGYVLEIATDENFQSSVRRLQSRSNNIAARLPEGTYYCRITVESDFDDARSTSAVRTIKVIKRDRLPAPTPLQPPAGQEISRVYLEKQGVLFNWRAHPQLVAAEIRIEGGGRTRTRTINGSVFSLKEALPEGAYSWQVRGVDEQGRAQTDFSAGSSFTVVPTQKLALRTPAAGETIDYMAARFPGVSLAWDRAGFGGKYVLRVSANQDLSKPLVSRELTVPYASAGQLGPGRYYWAVQLLGENGTVLTSSDTRSFEVSTVLANPTPEFPKQGTRVDMTARNTLPFRWEALRGAEAYVINVYSNKGGKRTRIAGGRVRGTEFLIQDLSLLDRGNFVWTISALRTSDGKTIASRAVESEFTITLQENEAPSVKPADIYIQ